MGGPMALIRCPPQKASENRCDKLTRGMMETHNDLNISIEIY